MKCNACWNIGLSFPGQSGLWEYCSNEAILFLIHKNELYGYCEEHGYWGEPNKDYYFPTEEELEVAKILCS